MESYFKTPIKYGDVLEIGVTVTRIGESSATFEFRASRTGDGALCFASIHVVVAVDMRSFRPVRIPDRYRQLLLKAGAEESQSRDTPGPEEP